MTNHPTVLEVMLTDVTAIVVFGNLTSTALPCAKGGTAVNGLQAFAALGIRVKA